jgi:hypothetical protein
MSDASPTPLPPLFKLDLGANGGQVAPSTPDAAASWLQIEVDFWSWIKRFDYGSHTRPLENALSLLTEALSVSTNARQFQDQPTRYSQEISRIGSLISQVYLEKKLPHSSSMLGKRIDEYKKESGDEAASFLASMLIPMSENPPIQPRSRDAWSGIIQGLFERNHLASAVPKSRLKAFDESSKNLLDKAEDRLGNKLQAFESLHRDYAMLSESIQKTAGEQSKAFNIDQGQRATDFKNIVENHKTEMENLRKTFREEIALRAPAEYWETKRQAHVSASKWTGVASLVGIVGAFCLLSAQVHDILKLGPTGTPEVWRVATLVLMGIFAIWAIRLVVRMFLSHLHLSTDAAERVVMVKTYLSLVEGRQLESKEDRQLILQALFRPTSDGIVKDEGLPLSLAEMITRPSKP